MTLDPAGIAKIDELVTAIKGYPDPRRAGEEWKQVFRLLQKSDIPQAKITGIVGMRDLARLAEAVDQLRSPQADAVVQAGGQGLDADTLRRAMKAFRKRSAVMRLDEESKIGGHGPLTKGVDGRFAAAIIPPDEWPVEVWQELVRQGRLKYLGHGFYELTNQAGE